MFNHAVANPTRLGSRLRALWQRFLFSSFACLPLRACFGLPLGLLLGNFEKKDAVNFLKVLKSKFKAKMIIIGVDLVKDIPTLISAYDDKKGITAKFNKNILRRINTELGGNIDLNSYKHLAIYNKSKKRIEMRLKCKKNSNIKVNGSKYLIKKNEEIHTENSHKYSIKSFKNLANKAGWKIKKTWVDNKKLFSVHCLDLG